MNIACIDRHGLIAVPKDLARCLVAKLRMDAETETLIVDSRPRRVWPAEVASTLDAHYGDKWGLEDQHALNGTALFVDAAQVRRLTPVECERLQGFPDNWTKIDEKTPDGPRYRALGNSMAVPVMRWIAERIQMVEDRE